LHRDAAEEAGAKCAAPTGAEDQKFRVKLGSDADQLGCWIALLHTEAGSVAQREIAGLSSEGGGIDAESFDARLGVDEVVALVIGRHVNQCEIQAEFTGEPGRGALDRRGLRGIVYARNK
jgi:hypothetical protein